MSSGICRGRARKGRKRTMKGDFTGGKGDWYLAKKQKRQSHLGRSGKKREKNATDSLYEGKKSHITDENKARGQQIRTYAVAARRRLPSSKMFQQEKTESHKLMSQSSLCAIRVRVLLKGKHARGAPYSRREKRTPIRKRGGRSEFSVSNNRNSYHAFGFDLYSREGEALVKENKPEPKRRLRRGPDTKPLQSFQPLGEVHNGKKKQQRSGEMTRHILPSSLSRGGLSKWKRQKTLGGLLNDQKKGFTQKTVQFLGNVTRGGIETRREFEKE